jgi:hypothetical protein
VTAAVFFGSGFGIGADSASFFNATSKAASSQDGPIMTGMSGLDRISGNP